MLVERKGFTLARCRQLHSPARAVKIAGVDPRNQISEASSLFVRGAMVLVTLNSPREKFWGAMLELTPAGLSVRGIDLNSFDDFAGLIRNGEAAVAGAVFFPMHRVERIELDLRQGPLPSLSDRFFAKTGRAAVQVLGVAEAAIEADDQ